MSLTLSLELIAQTKSDLLKNDRNIEGLMRRDRDIAVDTTRLDADSLQDIIEAAGLVGDKKTARAAESILLAQSGVFDKPVPNFKAFKGVLESFLKKDLIDGWIYVTEDDGRLYPQLVTGVSFDDGQGRSFSGDASVKIHTQAYGFSRENSKNRLSNLWFERLQPVGL